MDDHFESGLEDLSEEDLRYVGVTNLDFRTHLSKDELEEVQNLIFSINTLLQITFKDGTDLSDIEDLKHLVELSPMCDDKRIEKLILRKNSPDEIKKLLAMPYDNPDTWHIAYDIKNDTYMLTTLPNYRIMEEYMSIVLSCIREDMTLLEKIKEIYDFVKLLELDEKESDRLPDIIKNRKTNNRGFNILFRELLKRVNIPSYIGKIRRNDGDNYITIVYIDDDKYDAHGIYAFDPVSDSIPKDKYKSDAFRKINYNFFALTLDEISNTIDGDKLLEPLNLLISESVDYASRHLNHKDAKDLFEVFAMEIDELNDRSRKTKVISSDKLLQLFVSSIHEEDFLGLNRDISELITNNYNLRKNEIFKELPTKREIVSVHDV